MKKMKKYKVSDLNTLYTEAEQCDKEDFAEKRTNLLLIYGEHYSKKQLQNLSRSRNFSELSDQQKLRLTKNHIQNITKRITEQVTSTAPGITIEAKNTNEIQDQKSAELHLSVWEDAKVRFDYDEKIDEWGDDFVGLGEVACKMFFDPNEGKIVAYEPEVDENGETVLDEETKQPKKGRPKYSGSIVFEPVYGFNLLRDPNAQDMKKSPYLILRKVTDRKELVEKYPQHKDKISSAAEKAMIVFDGIKGTYRKTENEALVKEFYFRPCIQYPNGYFYYVCGDAMLEEGELPGGIFPIVWQYFERTQTSPRGYSPVRTMRPYQIEINRAASKTAEHQVTLGDDKLLIQNGSSISAGMALPGVRSINYAGAPPTILAGRDGSHYLNYMNAQIDELYKVMSVDEQDEAAQLDPYLMLYRAARQKKRFKRYIARFERFVKNVAKTYLQLAKLYLSEEEFIRVAGRVEQVNIEEFKNAEDIGYQITIKPQSEDIETKFGTQIFINQILQYVGGKLDTKQIGKILKYAPYGNVNEAFSDFTIDSDSAVNMILSLDRGKWPLITEFDDPVYMAQRLVARMRQADFVMLPFQSQEMYREALQTYKNMEQDNIMRIQRLQQGLIPTGGYLVTCDFYVPNPMNPGNTKKLKVPSEALNWMVKQLGLQGTVLDELENANPGLQAQIADGVNPGAPQPMPGEDMGVPNQAPVPSLM